MKQYDGGNRFSSRNLFCPFFFDAQRLRDDVRLFEESAGDRSSHKGTYHSPLPAEAIEAPQREIVAAITAAVPGYLILFAPHAFAPQRQLLSSNPPSPLVFLRISTHFTATHGIPPASPSLKTSSFESSSGVKPPDFTSNLPARLRALYTQ